tara:strand:+ start:184 stop:585 length:402 start_codon:yes stop_codon:yes gene_type:complete
MIKKKKMDWNDYPNFSKEEFDCSHSGLNEMKPEFMELLQELRTEYGKPMRITSGYRDKTHPIEAKKTIPGAHSTGQAADIGVDRGNAYEVLKLAFKYGFTGVGVQQKGSGRFIHIDIIKEGTENFLRPTVWSY